MLPNSFDDKGSRIEYIYPNDIGGMGRGCTIFLKTTMAQEVNYPALNDEVLRHKR